MRLASVHTDRGEVAGIDSIDHGIFLTAEACDLMKQKNIFYVPTFGSFYYYTERRKAEPWHVERTDAVKERHIQSFKLALEKDLTFAMGSDCGFASRFPNGKNALEKDGHIYLDHIHST